MVLTGNCNSQESWLVSSRESRVTSHAGHGSKSVTHCHLWCVVPAPVHPSLSDQYKHSLYLICGSLQSQPVMTAMKQRNRVFLTASAGRSLRCSVAYAWQLVSSGRGCCSNPAGPLSTVTARRLSVGVTVRVDCSLNSTAATELLPRNVVIWLASTFRDNWLNWVGVKRQTQTRNYSRARTRCGHVACAHASPHRFLKPNPTEPTEIIIWPNPTQPIIDTWQLKTIW